MATINGTTGIETPTVYVSAPTGALDVPAGTTAQRSSSPQLGMIRYNTTESTFEVYEGTAWKLINLVSY